VDKSGKHDLSQLRSIQDWYLRYPEPFPVSEVASVVVTSSSIRWKSINVLQAYQIPLS
jgi:Cu(I)/Ag(I) efflux system membrane protein CusA/SilA